jgi:hypothetical protein
LRCNLVRGLSALFNSQELQFEVSLILKAETAKMSQQLGA